MERPRVGRIRERSGGLIVVCLLFSLCPVSPCLARSIEIEDYDVAIDVQTSGGFDVTETIRLRFEGSWNGIHRRIPVIYKTAQGSDYALRISLTEVTDQSGARLRYEGSRDRHYDSLKIFVPGAADAVRTVVIRYHVRRGLRFFPDHDELYWNATGDEWSFPIAKARARVTLPRELVNVRANAFTGGFGSQERAAVISVDGIGRPADETFAAAAESPAPAADRHVVEVEATRPLGIREGLTVAVAWNPGEVHRPTPLERWVEWLWDNLALASLFSALVMLPPIAFILMLREWLAVGRDPRPGPVVVQYEPPAGLGPAEVGTLVDNSPDLRDLVAMLVDLAVKGFIGIRELRKGGWIDRARYGFDLLQPRERWASLPASEAAILEAVFGRLSGDTTLVTTNELEDHFHEKLPGIRSAIFGQLVGEGHYLERPDSVRSRYLMTAGVAGVAIALIAAGATAGFPRIPRETLIGAGIVSGLLTAAAIGLFGLVMPARTRKGAATRTSILGFQEFLSRVEGHRLASLPLTPELFEKYLPYAMALGVERRWSRAFEGICKVPPRWYQGSGMADTFQVADFSDNLGRMSVVTGTAMQSSPRSGEGSAFGGGGFLGGDSGGFSGGGFGGGGGDGF